MPLQEVIMTEGKGKKSRCPGITLSVLWVRFTYACGCRPRLPAVIILTY